MTDEHIEVSGETDIHRDSILAVLQGLMNGILKLKETITIEDVISNALDTFSDSQIDTLNEALASNRWDGLFRHLSDPTVLNMTEEEQKNLRKIYNNFLMNRRNNYGRFWTDSKSTEED